ncbi:hypothetical protein P8452_45800 [Trifolium repens]|nr:hypothetical protein P8452_45800 [Trifolium repens]
MDSGPYWISFKYLVDHSCYVDLTLDEYCSKGSRILLCQIMEAGQAVVQKVLAEKVSKILGYGWAGILRRYLVDPVEMWWPSNLAQVSLFRYLKK